MKTRLSLLLACLLCASFVYSQSGCQYRIWFDRNEASAQTGIASSGKQKLDIDVGHLSEGMHLLSIALLDEDGSVTSMRNGYFVRMAERDAAMTQDVKCYYSFDRSSAYTEARSMGGGTYALNLDVDGLSEGMHVVSMKLVTTNGEVTSMRNGYFVRMAERNAAMTQDVKCYYSFDRSSEYTEAQSMGGGTYALNFDVAGLKRGMHLVSMRLVAADGQVVSMRNSYFVKIESEGQGIAGYEYWVNGEYKDKVKVTLPEGVDSYSLVQELALPTYPLNTADFVFESVDGKPTVYNRNKITVRFFTTDNLTAQDTAVFIDESTRVEVASQPIAYGDTVTTACPAAHEIQWRHIDAAAGDTIALKTDSECTLQIFSADGQRLYKAVGEAATQYGGIRTADEGRYYVALHDVTAQSGTQILLMMQEDGNNDVARLQILAYCDSLTMLRDECIAGLAALQAESVRTLYTARLADTCTAWCDSLQALITAHQDDYTLPQYLPTAMQYLDRGAAALKATADEAVTADANAQAEITVDSYIAAVATATSLHIDSLEVLHEIARREYAPRMQHTGDTTITSLQGIKAKYTPLLELHHHTAEATEIKDNAIVTFGTLLAQARKRNEAVNDSIAQNTNNDAAREQMLAYSDSLSTLHRLYTADIAALKTDSVKAIYTARLNTIHTAYTDSLQALITAHDADKTLPQYLGTAGCYLANGAGALKATAEEASLADENAIAEQTVRSYIRALEEECGKYVGMLDGMLETVRDTYTAQMQSISEEAQSAIQSLIDTYSLQLALQDHTDEAQAILSTATEELATLYAQAQIENENETELFIACGDSYENTRDEWHLWKFGMENDETEGLYASLMNTGTMSADSVWVSDIMPADKWTFVTLPFTVKMGDIVHDNANVQYAIRRYDGAGRAQNGIANTAEGGTVSNWKRGRLMKRWRQARASFSSTTQ